MHKSSRTPLIPELYATIQNYFIKNPDSKIGIKIREQNNLPVASDGSRIYARATLNSDNPFLIYSKNSATFAKESEIIKDCLCLNPLIPLLPPLQHTKDTLKTHIAKLETETLDLKTGIFTGPRKPQVGNSTPIFFFYIFKIIDIRNSL